MMMGILINFATTTTVVSFGMLLFFLVHVLVLVLFLFCSCFCYILFLVLFFSCPFLTSLVPFPFQKKQHSNSSINYCQIKRRVNRGHPGRHH